MDKGEEGKPDDGTKARRVRQSDFLGFSTAELAGLTVEEIVGNKAAVTMVMHYYTQLSEENSSLRNDLNTAETYVSTYNTKRTDVTIGAGLQFLATLSIGFAINIITSNNPQTGSAGWFLLSMGVILQLLGLYYSLRISPK